MSNAQRDPGPESSMFGSKVSPACRDVLLLMENGMSSGPEEVRTYIVVGNDDMQYSIWPKCRELPDGWRIIGKEGQREECLQYIELVWTDMRPLSLQM
jgi:MbtH protein